MALFDSGKLVSLWHDNKIWPHSESMTCGRWDSLKLIERIERLAAVLKKSQESETKAFASLDEEWLLSQRGQILKEYGLKMPNLGLENPLNDRLGSAIAARIVSAYTRNIHMTQMIEKKKAARGSKVFVMAGGIHVPLQCELIRIEGSPRFAERYCEAFAPTLRPVMEFLTGRKYVVLAHKPVYRPRSATQDEL